MFVVRDIQISFHFKWSSTLIVRIEHHRDSLKIDRLLPWSLSLVLQLLQSTHSGDRKAQHENPLHACLIDDLLWHGWISIHRAIGFGESHAHYRGVQLDYDARRVSAQTTSLNHQVLSLNGDTALMTSKQLSLLS